MIFHNVEQNSLEWFALRTGKITASNFHLIMANYGKALGDPAKRYALHIALEQCTGNKIENNFSNGYMDRGRELEPIAREEYERQFFVDVMPGGFFDCGNYGASPDGLIYDDGLIEIKSVVPATHFDTLCRNDIDPAYKWQVVGHLFCSGRQWADFISFCPEFTENKRLIVIRKYTETLKNEMEMLENRLQEFSELIEIIKQKIR